MDKKDDGMKDKNKINKNNTDLATGYFVFNKRDVYARPLRDSTSHEPEAASLYIYTQR